MGMNEKLLNGLNEAKRDALVPYYLQHVIPNRGLGDLADRIKTSEDLYEYLLLDPQVSAKVPTTRIAEAIASTQLYLHRCREQLEPGVDTAAMAAASRPGGYFSYWNAYNKRYATWAGQQRLLHYPASYLDPELRYTKTTLFQELEQALNQGRITEERVEQAFTQYVNGLRSALQLRVVSGYQVEPMAEMVGPVFFCGAALEAPGEYYWRRVDNRDWTGSPPPVRNPMAWSEWRKIDAAIQPEGTPAIVYFDNRLHVLCLHKRVDGVEGVKLGVRAKAGQDPEWVQPEQTFTWELQFATLRPSGQWRLRSWPLKELLPQVVDPTRVFAAEIRSADGSGLPMLGVFVVTQEASGEKRHLCRFNQLLERLDAPGWDMRFSFSNGYYSTYSDVRVWQPLCVHAGTPGDYEIEVPSSFTFTFINNIFSLSKITVAVNSGDQCTFGATATSLNGASRVGLCIKRDSDPAILSNLIDLPVNQNREVTFTIPVPYQAVAGDAAFTVGAAWLGIPFSNVIPLVRKYTGTLPALRDFPGGHLYVRTSSSSMGASQSLRYQPANQFSEFVLVTLGGPLLEKKMQQGLDSLLSWTTQTVLVDPSDDAGNNIDRVLPFDGGVGLYLWELFFHAPFLVATRLLTEQRFDEAEAWLKRIFDPAGYRDPQGQLETINGKPRYWNVRPLQEDTAWNSSSPIGTDDPDLIAAADPMHYKLAVYLRWLELLMARGDHAYRQQTRDSLTEAKMWYMQALQLLGPPQGSPSPLLWDEPSLAAASAMENPLLRWLEKIIEARPVALAPGLVEQIQVVNGPFKAPINDAVLTYWDRAGARLGNLRQHLSIDGQPLALPLYEAPVSPTALQHARAAGDASGGGMDIGNLGLWAQRFPLLLERARSAVQQVMQFGTTLQGVLERRDADALAVLQQTQQGPLLALAQAVHTANLASLDHSLVALRKSREGAQARQQHYAGLVSEHISLGEQNVMTLRGEATEKQELAAESRLLASFLDAVPCEFTAGVSFGLGIAYMGTWVRLYAELNELDGLKKQGESSKLEVSEQYRRRRQDWQLQRDQAGHELQQLDAQIAAAEAQIAMARQQAAQTELEQAYSQAVLDVLRTRFSGQTLFNWLAGRLATLYYQLYDAAAGLCARAQRSYVWETGDTKPYLRPGCWSDVYQGLLAGESLQLSLQQLENAYLAWDKRALEVRKTVSLERLSGQTLCTRLGELLAGDGRDEGEATSLPVAVELRGGLLEITFDLKDMQIDDDYPGPLNLGDKRLVKSLSVSLPALLGPYQDIQALLRYTSNESLAEGCKAIAVSHGLNDSGQFQLDFSDGKYLPFEGLPINTGSFSLIFPHAETRQKDLLLSLTDIILHISYTIRTSGA